MALEGISPSIPLLVLEQDELKSMSSSIGRGVPDSKNLLFTAFEEGGLLQNPNNSNSFSHEDDLISVFSFSNSPNPITFGEPEPLTANATENQSHLDFEFLKPQGIPQFKNIVPSITVQQHVSSAAASNTDTDSIIAEAVKDAYQKGQMAGYAAATGLSSNSIFPAPPTGNFDYGFRMPVPGNTVVQVPSPWINTIESPMETPLSAYGTPLDLVASATPLGAPLLNTPWASPFMGSPFLSPFEDPMGLDRQQYQYSENRPIGDISTWWTENGGLVDTKSFSELLADTGLGMGMDPMNETLIGDTNGMFMHEPGSVMDQNADQEQSPNTPKTPKTKSSSKPLRPKRESKPRAKSSKRAEKGNIIEESMPSGQFWNVIKNDKQTLFQCPFEDCGKTFTRPYNLKSHYRSHTGERPYVCEFEDCVLKFSRKYDLKRHEKNHSGVKAVQCADCGKSFIRSDYLRRHQRIGDGKTQSECEIMREMADATDPAVDGCEDIDLDMCWKHHHESDDKSTPREDFL